MLSSYIFETLHTSCGSHLAVCIDAVYPHCFFAPYVESFQFFPSRSCPSQNILFPLFIFSPVLAFLLSCEKALKQKPNNVIIVSFPLIVHLVSSSIFFSLPLPNASDESVMRKNTC